MSLGLFDLKKALRDKTFFELILVLFLYLDARRRDSNHSLCELEHIVVVFTPLGDLKLADEVLPDLVNLLDSLLLHLFILDIKSVCDSFRPLTLHLHRVSFLLKRFSDLGFLHLFLFHLSRYGRS